MRELDASAILFRSLYSPSLPPPLPHAHLRVLHLLRSPFLSRGLKNKVAVNSLQRTQEACAWPLTSDAW